MRRDPWIYDCESYPNFFSCCLYHVASDTSYQFEISERYINGGIDFYHFLTTLPASNATMVGFNNVGYDYPLLHLIMLNQGFITANLINAKSQAIIASNDRFAHRVAPWDVMIHQTDLFLIHHFDNFGRYTSLKQLEFAMRAPNIADLPYDPMQEVSHEQMDDLIKYNWNDVRETFSFYQHTIEDIEFRDELSETLGKDATNWNDTKMGEQIFINRLPYDSCYNEDRSPKGTSRSSINLADCIFPYIHFNTSEFRTLHQYLLKQTITKTKGFFKNLKVEFDGIDYVFGLGGIHASRSWDTYHADDDYMILDLDVTSYYPSLAIVNRVKPEHLPDSFCDVYAELKQERVQYPKGSTLNKALKLALNGSYGKSNSVYSPLYDPQFTMTITLNGQLLLCMLAEWMTSIEGVHIIQVNTDGLTLHLPRSARGKVEEYRIMWQDYTQLDLEDSEYQHMWIRDVNNYIAQYTNGKMKRKGAYEHTPTDWSRNYSSPIIAKAVEACLVDDKLISETIHNCDNLFEFCKFVKAPKGSRLVIANPLGMHDADTPVQSNCRYYVAKDSPDVLIKIMPPLEEGRPPRRFEIESQRCVNVCNDMNDAKYPIDYDYYIKEAEKIYVDLTLGGFL